MKTIMLSFCLMAVTINANAFSAAHAVAVSSPTRNVSRHKSYIDGDNRIEKMSDTTYVVKTYTTDSLVVFKTLNEAVVFTNKDKAEWNIQRSNNIHRDKVRMGWALLIGFLVCCIPFVLTHLHFELHKLHGTWYYRGKRLFKN